MSRSWLLCGPGSSPDRQKSAPAPSEPHWSTPPGLLARPRPPGPVPSPCTVPFEFSARHLADLRGPETWRPGKRLHCTDVWSRPAVTVHMLSPRRDFANQLCVELPRSWASVPTVLCPEWSLNAHSGDRPPSSQSGVGVGARSAGPGSSGSCRRTPSTRGWGSAWVNVQV